MKRISLNSKATGPNPATRPSSHHASGLLALATQWRSARHHVTHKPQGWPIGRAATVIELAWPGVAHEQLGRPTARSHGAHHEWH
jgi:hypothetical protein